VYCPINLIFHVFKITFGIVVNFNKLRAALYDTKSCDGSVGIALGNRLDYRSYRVRFSARTGNFSLHHLVQNGSGAHPASYPMGIRDSFPGDKAAWA
jgi:hypothetical protein